MALVVDASVVVAALVDNGATGRWAEQQLQSGPLFAPHLLPVEVANILRKAGRAGQLSEDHATLAHQDLTRLQIELAPYEPFADRVWELRQTITAYDAWYVALAEALSVPLATADLRLARSATARCAFQTPSEDR